MSTVDVNFFGQVLTLTIPTAAPVYPFPVVKASSLGAKSGDSLASVVSKFKAITILDCEGILLTISDFKMAYYYTDTHRNGGYGFYNPNLGGVLNANIAMVPHSSTVGGNVSALSLYDVNNYIMLRLGPGNALQKYPTFFTGKLTGAPQGHIYSGLQTYSTVGSIIGPGTFSGIPNTFGGVPPYENESIAAYRDTNITYTDLDISGAGIGTSNLTNAGFYRFNRVNIHDCPYGSGITSYNLTNTLLEFNDCTTTNVGYAGLNFERCQGSTVNVNRHTFGKDAVDMIVDSDVGPVNIAITDPAKVVKMTIHTLYNYPPPDVSPNKQLDPVTHNHTTVTMGGVSHPEMVAFSTSYPQPSGTNGHPVPA